MKHELSSGLRESISNFVQVKRGLGYIYETQEYMLWCFDRFCSENYPGNSDLSKTMAMHWAERRSNELQKSQECRISVVRQLARFMNSIGVNAYVIPQNIPGKGPRYQPHIYTDHELQLFFQKTDSIRFDKRYPTRHLVSSVIFRLIYCCGLRHSEALLLRTDSFDLEKGIIRIMNSKGKCRNVIPSKDVLDICIKYHRLAESIYPGREWFFQNHHKKPYSMDSILRLFHECWHQTGLSITVGNQPRVHDLRHAFCRKRINLWMEEGRDLNALMPYLSQYLGHATFSETDYYLHLESDMFPLLREKSKIPTERVIPEVGYEAE